ncbi:MAG: hypothetical protein HUJ63_06175 [Enterococcus sp.]|nr:hypothetical protein [Enterococcus sp.]
MFDSDVMYFYYNLGMLHGDEELALCGDTLFSIWAPLIYFLNSRLCVNLGMRKKINNVEKVQQIALIFSYSSVL